MEVVGREARGLRDLLRRAEPAEPGDYFALFRCAIHFGATENALVLPPELSATVTVIAAGISSAEAFGSPTIAPGTLVIAPSGIPDMTSVSITLTTCRGSSAPLPFAYTYDAVASCPDPAPTIAPFALLGGPAGTVVTITKWTRYRVISG